MQVFSASVPFHLERTLKSHGWFQLPPFYWNEKDHSLDWIVSLDSKIVRLNLKQKNANEIKVSSNEEYDWDIVQNKIVHVFNLNLNLAGFYKICSENPLLAQLEKNGMGRLMRNESLFQDVFKSICGTNVQWKQAVNMIKNIAVCGVRYKDSEMFVFPSAQQILGAGEAFLKEKGRVGYRSPYLMDLCQRVVEGEPLLNKANPDALEKDELYALFLSFKGIGKVTANYLMSLYGYFDQMSIDSLVISYMRERHFNGITPTLKQVEAFFAHYGKYKYLVYWMEFIVTEGWNPDESSDS